MSVTERTTSMAHGTLLLMGGQLVFMISGYLINILLARVLGPAEVGLYGIVMAVLVWVEIFVMNGIPTAMQKFIGAGAHAAGVLQRTGLQMQLVYCLLVWLAFAVFAPIFSWALNDPKLSSLMWVASADIFIYGLYWLYAGVLSGKRAFGAQAATTVAYALGKLAAIAALVFGNWGVSGAFVGNWLGSAIGLGVGAVLARGTAGGKSSPEVRRTILEFSRPIILYSILMNLLLYIDIAFVKRYLTNAEVGYYHVAGTLARVPYFVFIALSFTLLPVLSRTIASQSQQQARNRINEVLRVMLILLAPLALFIWQNSGEIIRLLYTDSFDGATRILPALTVALIFYTYFYIGTTILNADGKPGLAFRFAIIAAAVDLVANRLLVPVFGASGAAWATAIASLVGVLGCGRFILRRFQAAVPLRSVLRVTVAGVLAFGLFSLWPAAAGVLVAKGILFILCYAAVLLLLRELSLDELISLWRPGRRHGSEISTSTARIHR